MSLQERCSVGAHNHVWNKPCHISKKQTPTFGVSRYESPRIATGNTFCQIQFLRHVGWDGKLLIGWSSRLNGKQLMGMASRCSKRC